MICCVRITNGNPPQKTRLNCSPDSKFPAITIQQVRIRTYQLRQLRSGTISIIVASKIADSYRLISGMQRRYTFHT